MEEINMNSMSQALENIKNEYGLEEFENVWVRYEDDGALLSFKSKGKSWKLYLFKEEDEIKRFDDGDIFCNVCDYKHRNTMGCQAP
tara:strand:- start:250 stop:507 length:258 start_codon:yes stop_codon:yes gene_type:complete